MDGSNGFGPPPLAPAKLEALEKLLASFESVAVAYSGGVDSALLLAVARRVLSNRAVAFIAVSPSLHPEELASARALARELGAELEEIATGEVDDPRYRENPPDRCHACKTHLFTAVREAAARRGLKVVVDGSNRDDAGDFRPGLRASREQGVRSPLMEVGLGKAEIRGLARARGLRVWDKPAMPCLASRIPYFSPVTEEKLRQVGEAERLLRRLGFAVVRVRHHGEVARIEVEAERLAELVRPAVRGAVDAGLRRLGFRFVTVDLDGFRSGKLHQVLEQTAF